MSQSGSPPPRRRAVMYVPDVDSLARVSVTHWAKRFQGLCGRSPTEVVLPGITPSGLSFDSEYCDWSNRLSSENLMPSWIQDVRTEFGSNFVVWASLNPTYSFMPNEMLCVRDQWDNPLTGNACLSNPRIVTLTENFAQELHAEGIDYIVLDVTDAFPNSGSDLYPVPGTDELTRIQNSCFCSHCSKQLVAEYWNEGTKPFRGAANITRFVLRPTKTGSDHIDVPRAWIRRPDIDSLASYALERGFVSQDNLNDEHAQQLMRYLAARGKVTAAAIRKLVDRIRSVGISKIAVILGESNFDMSQSTDLEYLVKAQVADEYWLPNVEPDYVLERGISVVQFLGVRGTYYYNFLYEDLRLLRERGIRNEDSNHARLLRHIRNASQNSFTKATRAVSDLFDELQGFAGIPMTRDDLLPLVRQLKNEVPGSALLVDSILQTLQFGGSADVPIEGAEDQIDVFQRPG